MALLILLDKLSNITADKRSPSCQQDVHDHASTEDIHLGVIPIPIQNLWRYIPRAPAAVD
jgi:hypothetical protein